MRENFPKTLQRLLLPERPNFLVVHSSLAGLMPPADVRRDVVSAFRNIAACGWTLVVPAFTFTFCQGVRFHLCDSRSETGILGDWILADVPEAVRTRHPIYSFIVFGPRAGEILDCRSTTTFSDDSPFGVFDRENALLLSLGCGPDKYLTQCHFYEERFQVPYRFYKTFSGMADYCDGEGEKFVQACMFVRDLALGIQNDFRPVADALAKCDRTSVLSLWRGEIRACRVRDVGEVVGSMLHQTPWALAGQPCQPRMGRESDKEGIPKLAVLSSVCGHVLEQELRSKLHELAPDWDYRLYSTSYGALVRELRDPKSELNAFNPTMAFCCDQIEDIAGQLVLNMENTTALFEVVTRHAHALADWCALYNCRLVITRLAQLGPTVSLSSINDNADVIDALNKQRYEVFATCGDRIVWLDPVPMASRLAASAMDDRLRFFGRIPFSRAMSERFAAKWAGMALAASGQGARAIILDLDNTLWGGILGEDGVQSLMIGGDYPGNAYQAFQQALKSLTARGIALAVCSKNDKETALGAMDCLDGMAIRSADLAVAEIGWRQKSLAVEDIAKQLNLGLESLLFIDDNPVEREAIKKYLPKVKVLELPPEPEGFLPALLDCPWLETVGTTAEDSWRGKNFRALTQVKQDRRTAASLEEFYAGLETVVAINPLGQGNVARAAQLCQKTNQFNTTTKRYDERDLLRLADGGSDVLVLSLKDKYSEEENIGVAVLCGDEGSSVSGYVDAYLLSCRVLGRGIEIPLAQWMIRKAAERGWHKLTGLVRRTDRNTPARNVFRDAGMREEREGVWSVATDCPSPLPDWFICIDRSVAGGGDMNRAENRLIDETASLFRVTFRINGSTPIGNARLGVTPGWDSLGHITLILALEKKFSIKFSAAELGEIVDFASLLRILESKINARR